MIKADLIDRVAAEAGISKREAAAALRALLSGITKALKMGQSVSLVGFGTFSVSQRAARSGRNPATGANTKIPASKVPKFKAGKTLKDAVK